MPSSPHATEPVAFHGFVHAWAVRTPSRTAVRERRGATATYAAVDEAASGVAQYLVAVGVEGGDRVASVLPPGLAFVTLLTAVSRLGAILVPLDPRYREADFIRFLGLAKPRVVIVGGGGANRSELVAAVRTATSGFDDLHVAFTPLKAPAASDDDGVGLLTIPAAVPEAGDPFLIIYTGGSTGVPKGAVLSHAAVIATSQREYRAVLDHTTVKPGDPFALVAALPTSHIGGCVEVVIGGLLAGAELICHDTWRADEVLASTVAHRAPILAGVPAMYRLLLRLPDLADYDLSAVQAAVVSGDRVDAALAAEIKLRLSATLLVSYGATEANVLTLTEPSAPEREFDEGLVGRALPGVTLEVRDSLGVTPLPAGTAGELYVSCVGVAGEYFGQPVETRQSFGDDGAFASGDLGVLDDRGRLYIRGRKKATIRVGSYTVLPTEIESLVLRHPSVRACAAVPLPHETLGEVVGLAVELRGVETLASTEEIRGLLRGLADFKVPRHVTVLNQLPLTRAGKIDRPALTQLLTKRHNS